MRKSCCCETHIKILQGRARAACWDVTDTKAILLQTHYRKPFRSYGTSEGHRGY